MKTIRLPLVVLVAMLVCFNGRSTAQPRFGARISRVDYEIRLSGNREVQALEMRIRFDIHGGAFHGFDLARIRGAQLLSDQAYAETDTGARHGLDIGSDTGGRFQVVLSGHRKLSRGGVTFVLPFEVTVGDTPLLSVRGPDGQVDWMAPVWADSMEAMRLSVFCGPDVTVSYDPSILDEMEVIRLPDARGIQFVKHRPVQQYQMKVPLGIQGIEALLEKKTAEHSAEAGAVAAVSPPKRPGGGTFVLAPLAVAFLLLFLVISKWRWIAGRQIEAGCEPSFLFLCSIGAGTRFAMAALLVVVGAGVQVFQSAAAGVPALAAAVALWLSALPAGAGLQANGGVWRPLSEDETRSLARDLRRYERRRLSFMDLGQPLGVLGFVAALGLVVMAIGWLKTFSDRTAFIVGLDAVLFLVPAWMFGGRDELPPDPVLEELKALRRIRRPVRRLMQKASPGSSGVLWARHVPACADRPAELRLRFDPAPKGFRSVELACELVRRGARISTSGVAIMRCDAGSVVARDIADSELRAEFRISPDLDEEIIVLRGRREKDPWVRPLAAALGRARQNG